MREKIPLIIAVIFFLAAVFGTYRYLKSKDVEVEQVEIVVAAIDVAQGDFFQTRHLGTRLIDKKSAVPGMFYAQEINDLINQKSASSIKKGQPIFRANIEIEELFVPDLTPLIEKGQRAISIPINDVAAVSQLVKPGDRVDILVNYEIPYIRETEVEVPNTGKFTVGQKETEPATIYLLQDVIVLAVGRTILSEEKYKDPSHRGYNAVTISVTPKEARALAFANKNAEEGYTLTLRNPEDDSVLDDYQVASYKTVLDLANLTELLEQRRTFQARIYEAGEEVR